MVLESSSRLSGLRALPWARILGGTALVLLVIGIVPPFRRVAAAATSRVILVVASPLSPSVGRFEQLSGASKVLAADGTEIGQLGAEQREPIALDRVPDHVSKAVLAAEDARFYQHSGVDPSAVFRAVFNRAKGGPVTGGSTITQQLAKLNFTDSRRTIFRKMKEVLYASKLESKYTKDELLEHYLNQVYFGHGAYGIALAADTYFGVPADQLTPSQAAMLAGKIQAPNALDPYRDPDPVRGRRDQVLTAMEGHGWLSPQDAATAKAKPIEVAPDPENRSGAAAQRSGRASHFVAYVGREVSRIDAFGDSAATREKQLFTGGYTVETTVDVKALDAARAAAEKFLGQEGDPTTAVVSVEPGDGAIRVLFGGLDPALQFDPASQGRRQPGSSFKPFVYLAMLDKGIDPRTVFDSGSPQTLECQGAPWAVENYEGEGSGPSNVDDAMTASINTVFAQVMVKVGPASVQKAAESAGIAHDNVTPAECAMALGGLRHGVSPLEQASAFATFAAKGVSAEPYAIARIKDPDGKVVYEHKKKTRQSIDDTETGVLNAALERVVQGGTGRAAAIGRPLAGKTGTSERNGNAWFVGFVPQLSTAVWVGYPEGDRPMDDVHGEEVTGGGFPSRIFAQYMSAALEGVPVRPIFTASPDDLDLNSPASSTTEAPSTSSSSSTSTSSTSSSLPPETDSTSVPPNDTSTLPPSPTTTSRRPTTTTPGPTTSAPPTTLGVGLPQGGKEKDQGSV